MLRNNSLHLLLSSLSLPLCLLDFPEHFSDFFLGLSELVLHGDSLHTQSILLCFEFFDQLLIEGDLSVELRELFTGLPKKVLLRLSLRVKGLELGVYVFLVAHQ